MREQDRLRSEHGESKCGAMCTERISGGNVPRYDWIEACGTLLVKYCVLAESNCGNTIVW